MKRLFLLLAIFSPALVGAETVSLDLTSGGRVFEGFGALKRRGLIQTTH